MLLQMGRGAVRSRADADLTTACVAGAHLVAWAARGHLVAPAHWSVWAHLGSNQEQPGYEPGALTD